MASPARHFCAHRQRDFETSALLRFGTHLDMAPKQFREFLANRQAKARSGHSVWGLNAAKLSKQNFHVPGGYPDEPLRISTLISTERTCIREIQAMPTYVYETTDLGKASTTSRST
jgi:hypothetical protein